MRLALHDLMTIIDSKKREYKVRKVICEVTVVHVWDVGVRGVGVFITLLLCGAGAVLKTKSPVLDH